MFDGEYINDKKDGKGKEYYINEKLIFEGEYLEGKKWNGKGYDKNDHIIYELKNGNGLFKELDEFGEKIEFEGDYKNGERNGKGKEYIDGILIFEGEYLDGKIWSGKGKEYCIGSDELLFEGEYMNGKRWNWIRFIQTWQCIIFKWK